jgi:hypothetical protein
MLTKEIYLQEQGYCSGDAGMWLQEAQATLQEMIGVEASTGQIQLPRKTQVTQRLYGNPAEEHK